jgi:hypothetical protein
MDSRIVVENFRPSFLRALGGFLASVSLATTLMVVLAA